MVSRLHVTLGEAYTALTQISINYVDVSVGTAIGTAIYPDDGRTTESLLRCADSSMYANKSEQSHMDN